MFKKIIVPNISFSYEYKINEKGEVWTPYKGGKIMGTSITKKGYHRISLVTIEGRKTFQVHRLVLMTFNPCKDMMNLEVNHIDGNKSNNSLENLEWCTGSFNIKHSLETGLKIPARGEKIGSNILTEKQVLEICELLKANNLSLSQIGERYGISRHCVFDIKRKKTWKWLTKNYIF